MNEFAILVPIPLFVAVVVPFPPSFELPVRYILSNDDNSLNGAFVTITLKSLPVWAKFPICEDTKLLSILIYSFMIDSLSEDLLSNDFGCKQISCLKFPIILSFLDSVLLSICGYDVDRLRENSIVF